MPAFTPIDLNTWERKEHFLHYHNRVPCSFSLTVKLDISPLKKKGLPVQPALLFAFTQIINKHVEFRIAFDKNKNLGFYEYLIPSFAFFHPQTQTFSTLWTEHQADFNTFLTQYRQDIALFGNNTQLEAKPNTPDYVFNVSTLPWCSFESFQLHLPMGNDYFIPIFTLGKYYPEGNRTLIPFAMQAHHAVCDGFHVCRFINELQQYLNNF